MLYHLGRYFRADRIWNGIDEKGDAVMTFSGELCWIDTFVLDCHPADGCRKLFVGLFLDIYVDPDDPTSPICLAQLKPQAEFRLLPVSLISCQVVLAPYHANQWKVLKL